MSVSETVLDGNAAGGLLREIFAVDMTQARIICAGCGARGQVGQLMAYVLEIGTILRCPGCDNPIVRIVQRDGHYWVDFRGTVCLEIQT
jgi:hypothetical protein